MHRTISPEELAHVARIQQDPLTSHAVKSVIDMNPVRGDDGLFRHGEQWLECSWCVPGTGEMPEPHVHFVLIGDNGGMRCEPQSVFWN